MITISKEVWSPMAQKCGRYVVEHAPQIAGYMGIGSFLVAIGLTYKNSEDIHEAVETRNYKKIIQKTWPIAAAATIGAVSVGYSRKEYDKRIQRILLENNLITAAYTDIKESMDENLTPKKVKELEHKSNEAKVHKVLAGVDNVERLECIGTGQMLIYEKLTGRLFRGDSVTIERAINETNARFNPDGRRGGEMTISLADLHDEMGLNCDPEIDRHICWHVSHDTIRFYWDTPEEQLDHMPVAVLCYGGYGVLDSFSEFRPLD